MTNHTFPCVVGNRIVELTAEQRDTGRRMSAEDKISGLLARIENLEQKLNELEQKLNELEQKEL